MFINPLDALGIDPSVPPDPAALRKARRRMQVELDLAGDEVEVGSTTYGRSDLMRTLQELDDTETVQLYHSLQRMPELTRFLQVGDPSYFRTGRRQPGEEALVRLISPHFAKQYGQALARAVRDRDAELIRVLTAHPPPVTPADGVGADRPVDAVLGEIRSHLERMREEVKAERLDAEHALVHVRLLVSPDALNALPLRFATARGQIARTLRNVAVMAFNAQDAVKEAYVLLSDAARIQVPADIGEDIAKQLETAREARDKELLHERYADEVAQCAGLMTTLHSLTKRAEEEELDPAEVTRRVRSFVDLHALNALPDALAEVVTQVAFALRGLSVTLWNTGDDATAALATLDVALALRLPPEATRKLQEDRRSIERLGTERLESEKADLRKLQEILQGMTRSVSAHRGDQVRWPLVAERLCDLLSTDRVGWLAAARAHAPVQVRQVLVELAPLLAGLANFSSRDYDNVVRHLRPLTEGDRQLEGIISRQSIAARVAEDPVLRRATSGPEIWEQGWFWWVVLLGTIMLLGQCSG